MTYKNIYFLGIGGIGMSAIARYFNAKGKNVAGYDLTSSKLTNELIAEGIDIHFSDDVALIPSIYKNIEDTLIVYTPAIPATNNEITYFRENNFEIQKRAQVLGEVTKLENALCVAGTHGKTTTSTMLAHILKESHVDCNAFLGGIAKNYTSNLLLSEISDLVVIEADEFDRSFHSLLPHMAIITSTDPDHLDIYGTHANYLESFAHFTSLIKPGGALIVKKGIELSPRLQDNVQLYYYDVNAKADFFADNIRVENGELLFDFFTPTSSVKNISLGVPLLINVENAVAAMAVAHLNGVTDSELKVAMENFKGIRRRFDVHYKSDKIVVIDDYAHHPEELKASIKSVKFLYPNKKVLGVFQPHLYSRTKEFYSEFADALSLLDAAALVEIYPARELPMEGVTSKLIYDLIGLKDKYMITKSELIDFVDNADFDVLLTIGAGDIDTYLPKIVDQIAAK